MQLILTTAEMTLGIVAGLAAAVAALTILAVAYELLRTASPPPTRVGRTVTFWSEVIALSLVGWLFVCLWFLL